MRPGWRIGSLDSLSWQGFDLDYLAASHLNTTSRRRHSVIKRIPVSVEIEKYLTIIY